MTEVFMENLLTKCLLGVWMNSPHGEAYAYMIRLKTKIIHKRSRDTLGKAGRIISTVKGFEPAPERCGSDCIRILFETPFGTAGALYNLDEAPLTHLIEAAGFKTDAAEEFTLTDLVGKRVVVLWAWQRGRRGGVFPKAFTIDSVQPESPSYEPLTAEQWDAFDCDKSGMKRTYSTQRSNADAPAEGSSAGGCSPF